MTPKASGSAPVSSGASGPALTSMAVFTGETGVFEIFSIEGNPLLETDNWRIFVSKGPEGNLGLMKIAKTESDNAVIDREVRILRTLQTIAEEIDSEAAEGTNPPFYGAMFPKVLEVVNADGRVAAFMGYHNSIKSYRQFVPMSVMLGESQRVDMKTATWMYGKLMKLASFIHSCGFTIGHIDATNVMISLEADGQEIHGIFVLDFSSAEEEVDNETAQLEVQAIANLIWESIGGSESNPPHDPDIMTSEQHEQYAAFLQRARSGETEGAQAEFENMYSMADEIWPKVPVADDSGRMKRQFHNWKTYDKA